MSVKQNKRVLLNISGEIFETYEDTLTRFPETLLGQKTKLKLYYNSQTNEHFFDRSRLCFEAILYFYQSNGFLRCPPGVQVNIFETECRYYKLPEEFINKMRRREGMICDSFEERTQHENPSLEPIIWNILNLSQVIWLFNIFSLFITCVSVITAILDTTHLHHVYLNSHVIEGFLIGWFLIELILRFTFSRSKFEFARCPMTLIDIFAVMPYFVSLIIQSKLADEVTIFKILKLVRVIRLFRLSRYSRRLQVIATFLKYMVRSYTLLMICFIMISFLGGSFMYYIERYNDDNEFTSIPQGLWWAVQTITLVGYGDLIPMTIIGKTVACCFLMAALLLVSLPMLNIVSEFTTIYSRNVAFHGCSMLAKREQ